MVISRTMLSLENVHFGGIGDDWGRVEPPGTSWLARSVGRNGQASLTCWAAAARFLLPVPLPALPVPPLPVMAAPPPRVPVDESPEEWLHAPIEPASRRAARLRRNVAVMPE